MNKKMRSLLSVLLLIYEVNANINIEVEQLKPTGLRVTFYSDEGRTNYFAFHANINRPIGLNEQGDISKLITQPVNGLWMIEDTDVKFNNGDVVNYRATVTEKSFWPNNNDNIAILQIKGFMLTGVQWRHSFDFTRNECKISSTLINDGVAVCSNTVMFEDYFNSRFIDTQKWDIQKYIPSAPDYEFNSYEPETCTQNQNLLYIKPIVRSDPTAAEPLDLTNGCTHPSQENCKEKFSIQIQPPVISGKIMSKFSFKYGIIEVRAQVPRGDWIYPKIELIPKNHKFSNNSGTMLLAYTRGNEGLNNELHFGPVIDSNKFAYTSKLTGNKWNYDFHKFTLIWTPNQFRFSVDDSRQTSLIDIDFTKHEYSSSSFKRSSPFDEEFLISLGVGVGGFTDFKDLVVTPWKHRSVKARKQFFSNRQSWLPSWQGENAALKVDYIRVTSL